VIKSNSDHIEEIAGLIESAPAGMVLFEATYPYRVIISNKVYNSMWPEPIPSCGLAGSNLIEYVPQAEESGILDIFNQVAQTGESVTLFEFPYDGLAKGRTWWNWNLYPVMTDGKITALGHMAVDVTDQVTSRMQVQESEARYKSLAENVQSIFVRYDKSFRIVYLSKKAEEVTGIPVSEFIGKTNREVGTPEELCDLWEEGINFVFETGKPKNIEFEFPHVDGVRTFDLRLSPEYDAQSKVAYVLGLATDITEHKRMAAELVESERQFRTLADAMPQLVWMADADGYLFWYNKRWYEYTGTTPEQMKGWGWQSVHDPEILPSVLEKWKASIATGEPFNMEFPLKGADGKYRMFLTRTTPFKDSEGNVVRWFGTNTDISERRELEAHKREFYRRMILGATDGKLVISDRKEIDALISSPLNTWDIQALSEFAAMRNETKQLARKSGLSEDLVLHFQACVVEAAANAIKHAGGGKAHLSCNGESLIYSVSDAGSGIGALELPDVALTNGYSTAGTLGMGYKVMLRFADKVYLATGPEGTTVAIEMKIRSSDPLAAVVQNQMPLLKT